LLLIHNIIQAIEEFAPSAYQESYDNAGLCVGSPHAEARAALLCLDVTEAVVHEAIDKGANLIISHHPVIFSGLKQITGRTATERIVQLALKHDVALYAAHTNLDSVRGGVSEKMCDQLALKNRRILRTTDIPNVGLGMLGELEAPLSANDFLLFVKKIFGNPFIKYSNSGKANICSIAVCSGSGGSLLSSAIASGADAYVTADLKYHEFQIASENLLAVDVGHYESEIAAVDIFYEVITKKFPIFAVHLSEAAVNPVRYL
jgi:dinuclear metal center YbgI/SA1388 family protein